MGSGKKSLESVAVEALDAVLALNVSAGEALSECREHYVGNIILSYTTTAMFCLGEVVRHLSLSNRLSETQVVAGDAHVVDCDSDVLDFLEATSSGEDFSATVGNFCVNKMRTKGGE